ncbi:MAG TPA: hypothetical protein VJV96_19960 [Candidatus Angelobacter sp.]|nr:hypothetical protein [Candidatus Angelobacter sp.]
MKSKTTATDMRPQVEQNSVANRIEQEQAEETLDSGVSAGESKEHGHFRTWWSDYQKKMRSAFQAILLKLQMQGEQ